MKKHGKDKGMFFVEYPYLEPNSLPRIEL